MSILETAKAFFDACEGGKGWSGCKGWCHDDAGFSCQADALADTKTLEAYTEWAKGLLPPIPDIHPEVKCFSADEARNCVSVYAVIRGHQTGEGGPVPPTGNRLASDYVYVMQFEGGKISHMTKIWNDVQGLRQLGWA